MSKTIELTPDEQAALLVLIEWFNSTTKSKQSEGESKNSEFSELEVAVTSILDKLINDKNR